MPFCYFPFYLGEVDTTTLLQLGRLLGYKADTQVWWVDMVVIPFEGY
jgi:hypothetical protein